MTIEELEKKFINSLQEGSSSSFYKTLFEEFKQTKSHQSPNGLKYTIYT